jgi:hypothetical protein
MMIVLVMHASNCKSNFKLQWCMVAGRPGDTLPRPQAEPGARARADARSHARGARARAVARTHSSMLALAHARARTSMQERTNMRAGTRSRTRVHKCMHACTHARTHEPKNARHATARSGQPELRV